MRAVGFALALAVIAACGSAAKPPPAAPVAIKNDPPAAPPPVDDRWVPYTSADGGFTVKFPGTPAEQTEDVGDGVMIHIASVDLGTAAYLVGWQIQPTTASKVPKEVLDGAQAGMLGAFPGATVLAQSDVTLDGRYPGRALTTKIVDPDATQFSRYYLVGDRLYQLAALGEGDGAPADWKTFLDSFALTAK